MSSGKFHCTNRLMFSVRVMKLDPTPMSYVDEHYELFNSDAQICLLLELFLFYLLQYKCVVFNEYLCCFHIEKYYTY